MKEQQERAGELEILPGAWMEGRPTATQLDEPGAGRRVEHARAEAPGVRSLQGWEGGGVSEDSTESRVNKQGAGETGKGEAAADDR